VLCAVTTIHTDRFVLRPFRKTDLEAFEFIDSAEWRKYLFHSFPERKEFIENCYGILKEEWEGGA